jgi:hypothetical protein
MATGGAELRLRLRTLQQGSRCRALLSEDIGSVLKGGVNVCQRQLVNEVRGPLVAIWIGSTGNRNCGLIHGRIDAGTKWETVSGQFGGYLRQSSAPHGKSHRVSLQL